MDPVKLLAGHYYDSSRSRWNSLKHKTKTKKEVFLLLLLLLSFSFLLKAFRTRSTYKGYSMESIETIRCPPISSTAPNQA